MGQISMENNSIFKANPENTVAEFDEKNNSEARFAGK